MAVDVKEIITAHLISLTYYHTQSMITSASLVILKAALVLSEKKMRDKIWMMHQV